MAASLAAKWRAGRMRWAEVLAVMAVLVRPGWVACEDVPAWSDPEASILAQYVMTPAYITTNITSWASNADNPCDFTYITCNPGGKNTIILDMHARNIMGKLSPWVAYLHQLETLTLDDNNFTGPIPALLGYLANLSSLTLSNNAFSGAIPPELSNATKLARVDFSNNNLTGSIPSSFGNLTILDTLNLANNSLSGGIPVELGSLSRLNVLNLANNNLSGSVPDKLTRFCTSGAFDGNPYLDTIVCTYSPPPPPLIPKKSSSAGAIIGGVVGGIAIVLIIAGVLAWRILMKKPYVSSKSLHAELLPHSGTSNGSSAYTFLDRIRRFTLAEMLEATMEFSDDRVLGEGGSGVVYKGVLPGDRHIAVKRLKRFYSRGDDQFVRELDIISRTVHANLIQLEGYCLEAGERLLVFPYMSNGSVAAHLRGGPKPLIPFVVRRTIARDVAEGICYMHFGCSPQLLHRDIKADNVLLTNSWQAKVTDFGLVKMVGTDDEVQQTALRGTIGYIAPEYSSSGNVSDKTDVFAFGVFLVELTLGRSSQELAEVVPDSYTLQEWIATLLQQNKLREVVERSDTVSPETFRELEELLQLAVLCMQEHPDSRLSMKDCGVILRGEGLGDRWSQWQNPDTGVISIPDGEDNPAHSRGPAWTGSNLSAYSGGQTGEWNSQAFPIDLSGPR